MPKSHEQNLGSSAVPEEVLKIKSEQENGNEQKEEFIVGEIVLVADQYVDENIVVPEDGPALTEKAEKHYSAWRKKYDSLGKFNGRLAEIVKISGDYADVKERGSDNDFRNIYTIHLDALTKLSKEELEKRGKEQEFNIGDKVRLRRSTGGGLKKGMIGEVYGEVKEKKGGWVSFKIPKDLELEMNKKTGFVGDEYRLGFSGPDRFDIELVESEN